jgi:putative component of membrane protein insertase Oxa1/YidC/SpoIIIJ protein YidD
MRCFFLGMLCLSARTLAMGQDTAADIILLRQSHNASLPQHQARPRPTFNPLMLTYRLGLSFYQQAISAQLATNCAFQVSCSRHSGAMVKQFGLAKGYFLTFDRLSRCNKITAMETFPARLDKQGKIIETPADFRFRLP